jgi:multiple sugar transport system ATP-binding protein
MAEIITKDVNKRFGDFTAVKDSNLTIDDGSFFVLLGPSGCGKTTTLRMIAGLELPTDGKIFLDSEDVTFLRASQRDIAFVFQLFALYPHMNVQKNLAFPLKMQGIPKAEIKQKVQEVARLLRIQDILKSKVSGLAGGDRQRVALGRAIIRRPKAFLMDEPLGTLDAEFRETMCSELKKLHTDIDATTVYVTHDQNEAMAMGDKVGVMDKGVILQADEPLVIYNKPKSMFVGNFIGSPAMNFLPVNSGLRKGDTSVTIDNYTIEIPQCHEDSHTDINHLGIRAENIEVTENSGLRGKVFGVEFLAARQIITVETKGGIIKVRAPNTVKARINDNIGLRFNPRSIIVYNDDNGMAVKSEFMD